MLRDLKTLSHLVYHVENWCKVSWPIEVNVLESLLISFKDSLKTIAFRITDVTVECKTVTWTVVMRIELQISTKTKGRELLIRVIELQDVSN